MSKINGSGLMAGRRYVTPVGFLARAKTQTYVLYVLFTCHIITFSTYLNGINSNVVRIAQAICLAIIAFYALLAIVRQRHILTVACMIAVLIYLVILQVAFAQQNGTPVNLNSVIGFTFIGSTIVFLQIDLPLQRKLRIAFTVTAIYSLVYVVLGSFLYKLGLSAGSGVAQSADDRGDRLIYALGYGGLGFAVVVANFRYRFRTGFRYLLLGSPIIVALLLANSRAFLTLITVCVLVRLVSNFRGAGAALAAFVTVAAAALMLCLPLNINPYTPLQSDPSSRSRMFEFDMARSIVLEHPFVGMGISSGEPGTLRKVRDWDAPSSYRKWVGLFPSDLSYFGVLLQFGLIGSLLILAAIPLSINGRLDPNADQATVFAARVIGLLIPLYAPSGISGSCTLLYALLIAEHLRARKQSRSTTSPEKTVTQAETDAAVAAMLASLGGSYSDRWKARRALSEITRK